MKSECLLRGGLWRFGGIAFLLTLAAIAGVAAYADELIAEKPIGNGEPLALNLADYYQEDLDSDSDFESFTGRQIVDGLPFEIKGEFELYGKTAASRTNGKGRPDHVKGIRIGRKFDELHLIHYTTWPDVEGETVAYVCVHYAGGSEAILPIRYGYQVLDICNLPSYEKETIKDPDTTICWRRAPVVYKAPMRLTKSKFVNPIPDEVVETMDLVSARHLASYHLMAATLANHRAVRAVQYPGDRHFDGKLVIHVLDATTGKPITDALVTTSMNVVDEGVVGTPFYTTSNGEGTIPYPTHDTKSISASVEKEGYQSDGAYWTSSIPNTFVFRLKPIVEE
jgi:hypothetical protein